MKKYIFAVLWFASAGFAMADSSIAVPVEDEGPMGTPKLIVPTKATGIAEPLVVKEGVRELRVLASAPIPEEVENETQARALSREAAVVRGQTALLSYILEKPTRSKKKLSEAEIPSLELQNNIRGYIQGARVARTEWGPKKCTVLLILNKKYLKEILSKN